MADLSAPYLNRSGTAALEEAAFGADWNGPLVHECVRAELNARRRGSASTLTRGKVRGGGVKPWRQKGTGRARAGSIRSPLWAGGGIVFGPSPRAYTVKVNRKVRRAALRSALSLHAGRGSLGMLDAGAFEAPRTKQAAEALGGSELARPTLVVVEDGAAAKSFRNLSGVEVRAPGDAGIADIVRAASLVLSDAALEHLTGLARKEPRGGRAEAEEVAA